MQIKPPTWGAPKTRKSLWLGLGYLGRRLWRLAVHANDQPDRVAKGVALGLFIGWLPLVGIQTVIAIVLCWPLRANFAASVPGVWLSNPLTMVPMYLLNNWVGSLFYGRRISLAEMKEIWDTVAEYGLLGIDDATMYLLTKVWDITAPMLVGGVLIGLVVAIPGYFLSLKAANAINKRRNERRDHYRGSTQNEQVAAPSPSQSSTSTSSADHA